MTNIVTSNGQGQRMRLMSFFPIGRRGFKGRHSVIGTMSSRRAVERVHRRLACIVTAASGWSDWTTSAATTTAAQEDGPATPSGNARGSRSIAAISRVPRSRRPHPYILYLAATWPPHAGVGHSNERPLDDLQISLVGDAPVLEGEAGVFLLPSFLAAMHVSLGAAFAAPART